MTSDHSPGVAAVVARNTPDYLSDNSDIGYWALEITKAGDPFDKDHFVTYRLSEARPNWVSPEGFLLNSGGTQGGCPGSTLLLWCPLPIFGSVAFSLGHGFSRAVQWDDEVWRVQNKCTHFPD